MIAKVKVTDLPIVILLYVIMLNVMVPFWVHQDLTNHQLCFNVVNFYDNSYPESSKIQLFNNVIGS